MSLCSLGLSANLLKSNFLLKIKASRSRSNGIYNHFRVCMTPTKSIKMIGTQYMPCNSPNPLFYKSNCYRRQVCSEQKPIDLYIVHSNICFLLVRYCQGTKLIIALQKDVELKTLVVKLYNLRAEPGLQSYT